MLIGPDGCQAFARFIICRTTAGMPASCSCSATSFASPALRSLSDTIDPDFQAARRLF
jgi:hypothetical protein